MRLTRAALLIVLCVPMLLSAAQAQNVTVTVQDGFAGGLATARRTADTTLRAFACGVGTYGGACEDIGNNCFSSGSSSSCICTMMCSGFISRNATDSHVSQGTTYYTAGTSGGIDDPSPDGTFRALTTANATLTNSTSGLPLLSLSLVMGKSVTGTPPAGSGSGVGAVPEYSANVNGNVPFTVSIGDWGACCNPLQSCFLTERSSCSGLFLGEGSVCESGDCPDALDSGACCRSNNTCEIMTFAECATPDRFRGRNTVCSPLACGSGVASPLAIFEVDDSNGVLHSEPGLFPTSSGARIVPIGAGRVGLTNGTYEIRFSETIDQDAPAGYSGTFNLELVTVGQAVGACCTDSGVCEVVAEVDCPFGAGTFLGIGTTCGPTACLGACCAPAGACSLSSRSACSGANGLFRGIGLACLPSSCPGACCSVAGACTFGPVSDCAAGIFRGVDQPCTPTSCTGACCGTDGTCVVRAATDCSATGGRFRGTDLACGTLTCAGACCAQAGSCELVSAAGCADNGGRWRGLDSPCEPLTCPGACCAFTGECTFTSAANCSASDGSWRGLDLPCEPLTCPGACCLLDRSCIITGLGICTGQRGTYLGLDTTCDNMPCCCRPWDNGYADGHGGQASQIGADADWQPLVGVSFDDFWLCEGQINIIDHVSGVMATNSITPKFIIAILPDCNGLPDITSPIAVAGLAGTRFDVAQEDVPFILGRIEQDVHRGPDADGYSLIEAKAVFDGKKLALKGGSYWVTVFGVSATLNPLDEFFWQTSGNNVVKGRPGVFFDGDTFRTSDELCCGCTDYNFCVEGETCKVLLDNGPPVINFGPIQFPGVASLQNGGNIQTRSRAADKLVLPPCDRFEPCYIEGYMWTNCDRIALQFFRDACHCPDDAEPGSAFRLADCVMGTGIRVLDPSGVEVELKKAQFFFPEPAEMLALLGASDASGRNIWLSLVGFGDNRQNARAYFAFGSRCDRPCNSFGPGCFRPAPFDITHWGPNGLAGTSVPGFDHAILVAVREVPDFVLLPPIAVQDPCPADVNRSGDLTVQDLFDFLAVYFAGCP